MIKIINSSERWRRFLLFGGLVAAGGTLQGTALAAPGGLAVVQADDAQGQVASDDADAVKKLKAELEKAKAALQASKKALAKYAAAEAKEMAAVEAVEQLKQDMKELFDEKKAADKKWQQDIANAKTNVEKSRLYRSRPSTKFGDEFYALYEDNEGVDGAEIALQQALTFGGRQTKAKAAKSLLTLVDDLDAEKQMASYILLAQFGSGKSREAGLEALLDLAKQGKGTGGLLTQVVAAPGNEGADIRQQAAALIWKQVQEDPESANAPRMLALVGEKGKAEIAISAYRALLENHPESQELKRFFTRPPRTPSAATEALMKAAMENGSRELQVQASLAFAKYVEGRDRFKAFYADANETQIASIGQETYKYLMQSGSDPAEMKKVESLLDSYVKSSSGLLTRAKDQLFVINNLTPGATAMEIEGVDLEGNEFKLSDYRGKVVFLDFWGDW